MNINVTLLVEESIATKIYKSEIEELKEKMFNNPDFDSVQVSILTNENNKAVINGGLDNNTKENNLVFIVSPTCSPIWSNGEVYNLLNDLKSNSLVNIIHILPQHDWEKVRLTTYSNTLTITPDVKSNSQINNTLPFLISKDEFKDTLLLPITTLNNVDQLLSTITNGGQITNTILYQGDNSVDLCSQPKDTKQQIREFRFKTSEDAFALALYMSRLESFTLSDMDFVRQHMLPHTDKHATVLCTLGNIMEEITTQDFRNMEPRYKLKDDIREELSGSISFSKAYAITLLMEEKNIQDSLTAFPPTNKPKI